MNSIKNILCYATTIIILSGCEKEEFPEVEAINVKEPITIASDTLFINITKEDGKTYRVIWFIKSEFPEIYNQD